MFINPHTSTMKSSYFKLSIRFDALFPRRVHAPRQHRSLRRFLWALGITFEAGGQCVQMFLLALFDRSRHLETPLSLPSY